MLPLIYNLSRSDLRAACATAGGQAWRADQIWRWLYTRHVETWDAMHNLPNALRTALASRFELTPFSLANSQGDPDTARKLLLRLRDGECIEIVLLADHARHTLCVSSQVGCRFACAFCASGQAGFRRQLETGEIVGETLAATRMLGSRPNNIVFMGIGEPLDNYDAVLAAIRILNDPDGLNIGARHITISTNGIIPGIERLADEGLQVELAVSLHAPNDTVRNRLMPVNRRFPLPELLSSCARYTQRTKRIITFEYTLMRGINDSVAQAQELADRLKTFPSRVNLIPLSPVSGFDGQPSAPGVAGHFLTALAKAGINATMRNSQGQRIQAACGQLRLQHLKAT
ncbi:MAG: 23S rRNA (adenine(2503)-C(2))-methyltransferase RlmN [bacterium]